MKQVYEGIVRVEECNKKDIPKTFLQYFLVAENSTSYPTCEHLFIDFEDKNVRVTVEEIE